MQPAAASRSDDDRSSLTVRDFLNENNNECDDLAICFNQGSGDDEIDDINFGF